MRKYIDILTEEAFVRGTTSHKPLAEVTSEDVVTAWFAASDLLGVIHSGEWWHEAWADPDGDYSKAPPIPNSLSELTSEGRARMARHYAEWIELAREHLVEVARNAVIPVHRYLSRLSDLNQPLGVHWSLGHHETTLSEFGEHVVDGMVANESVDWVSTLARAVFWWDAEHEISVVAGSSIVLVRLVFDENAKGTA